MDRPRTDVDTLQKPNASPRRWGLAGLCLIHAAIFLWVAWALPWSSWTFFSLTTILLALLHFGVGISSALKLVFLSHLWRILSFVSLGYSAVAICAVAVTGSYVASLYGGLGQGVAAALIICLAAFCLWTLPIAIWGLSCTTPWISELRLRRRAQVIGLVVVLLVMGLSLARAYFSAKSDDAPLPKHLPFHNTSFPKKAASEKPASTTKRRDALFSPRPVSCKRSLNGPWTTAILTYRENADRKSRVRLHCLQALPKDFAQAYKKAIAKMREDLSLSVDIVTHRNKVAIGSSLLDAVKIRPGLDGICHKKDCFMPWQLIGLGQFGASAPVKGVPDWKFGTDDKRLRALFIDEKKQNLPHGASPRKTENPSHVEEDPNTNRSETPLTLTRITTRSFVRTPGKRFVELKRRRSSQKSFSRYVPKTASQRQDKGLSSDVVRNAVDSALSFIRRAQQLDGRFRYSLNPHTGQQERHHINVPRQAGTTMALCNLNQNQQERQRQSGARTIRRSLRKLASLQAKLGSVSAMRDNQVSEVLRIGPSALSLVAFLRCLDYAKDDYESLILGLGRFLLHLQKDDGSFYVAYDEKRKTRNTDPPSWFGPGQTMLALVLLEEALPKMKAHEAKKLHPKVHAALSKSMDHYGNSYWSHPLASFFFLEENWHCLAARAALHIHRHDSYERFCINYVSFRDRFQFEAPGSVSTEFLGGFGITNIMTPQTTPAAAHAETLAAAIPIMRARNIPTSAWETKMRGLISFLLRQQWDETSCIFCKHPRRTIGGFSESIATSAIRIDFVQHAASGIYQGAKVLGL